jgi:hypothetical protein
VAQQGWWLPLLEGAGGLWETAVARRASAGRVGRPLLESQQAAAPGETGWTRSAGLEMLPFFGVNLE